MRRVGASEAEDKTQAMVQRQEQGGEEAQMTPLDKVQLVERSLAELQQQVSRASGLFADSSSEIQVRTSIRVSGDRGRCGW